MQDVAMVMLRVDDIGFARIAGCMKGIFVVRQGMQIFRGGQEEHACQDNKNSSGLAKEGQLAPKVMNPKNRAGILFLVLDFNNAEC